jgi:quercetin dioxygenase-like cupin family protein
MQGAQLRPLVLLPGFWFAWSQFRPDTELFTVPAAAHAAAPVWEALLRAPLPADAVPKLTALRLHVAGGRPPSPAHRHAGPVFAYLLSGRVENEVEPNPARIYETGGYFYEAPMKVHRRLWNTSATQAAEILVFMAGDAGANADRTALRATALATTERQELTLHRVTLGTNARATSRAHDGPALVYVAAGAVEVGGSAGTPRTLGAGEVIVEAANEGTVTYRNVSGTSAAKLLVYSASTVR